MRTWRRRRPWRAAVRRTAAPRRNHSHHPLLLSGLAGVGLALALILFVDVQLRPILDAMATAQVKNVVTKALDGAIARQVEERGLTYGDIITMEKDASGRITALTSNMAQLNSLRTGILGAAVEAVDGMDTEELSIPVGNLSGVNFLSGRGFSLPVEVVSVGTAHAEFTNVFTGAGINQTRHQILLEVAVTVDVLLPGETLRTDVSAQVPVAETVIVGTVPDTYLQVGQ